MSTGISSRIELPSSSAKYDGMKNSESEYDMDADSDDLDDNSIDEMDDITTNVEQDKASTIIRDLKTALIASRYVFLILLCLSLVLMYQLTIAPYVINPWTNHDDGVVNTAEKLKYVRPVLSTDEIDEIYTNLRSSESTFWLPDPYYNVVKLRHFTHVDDDGNFALPDMFYDGVVYGLTWEHSHDNEYSRQSTREDKSKLVVDNLERELKEMKPQPTGIMRRSSRNNETGWLEDGLAVHFSLQDLRKQGRLSNDILYPWNGITDDILKIARNHRQAYIFIWFPHRFGKEHENFVPNTRYQNVIQRIVPTRTGYNAIKSEVVVWMSAINFTNTLKEEDVIQKPWTDEDHWSMYKNQQDEIYKNAAKLHNEKEQQQQIADKRHQTGNPNGLTSDL